MTLYKKYPIIKIAALACSLVFTNVISCQATIYKGSSIYIEKTGVEGVDAEAFALEDAKREAIESNLVLITSNTLIKDMKVSRDEIKTFARGAAKLLPNSITKTTQKIVDGEKIIKIVADFDVDENSVRKSIESYINNRTTIKEFTDVFDKYDSVNLKRQYIINKKLAYLNTENIDFTKEEKIKLHNYLLNNLNREGVTDFISEANRNFRDGLYIKSNFYIDELLWIIDNTKMFDNPISAKAKFLVKKGENYEAMNMRTEAKKTLLKAADVYPKYVRSWKMLVDYADNEEERRYYISNTQKLDRVSALIAESDNYYKRIDYMKALECINEAIDLEGMDDNTDSNGINERLCTLYQRQGSIYNTMNYNDKALQYFEKAIANNKYDSYVYLSRGCLYEKLGQYDNAMKDFDTIISNITQGKTNMRCLDAAYFNKGVIFSHEGDYVNSLKYINKAIEINPGLAMAYQFKSTVEGKLRK